jgi:small subunit ribosomal protein S13
MAENRQEIRPEIRHLVRVSNTDLNGEKPIFQALRKIKGISFMYANAVCYMAGIDKHIKAGILTESQIKKLEEVMRNPARFGCPEWMLNRKKDPETGQDMHLIMSDLDFAQEMDVKMMKKVKSYKGLRHQWGLPVRGQRTRSNFRKNKGKGLGVKKKKEAPAKA